MERAYYSGEIKSFCQASEVTILGAIVGKCDFSIEETQKRAWLEEIALLQKDLSSFAGYIAFEFSIPRMGKRIDVVLIIDAVIFVLEFKVGEDHFPKESLQQVFDYS